MAWKEFGHKESAPVKRETRESIELSMDDITLALQAYVKKLTGKEYVSVYSDGVCFKNGSIAEPVTSVVVSWGNSYKK